MKVTIPSTALAESLRAYDPGYRDLAVNDPPDFSVDAR